MCWYLFPPYQGGLPSNASIANGFKFGKKQFASTHTRANAKLEGIPEDSVLPWLPTTRICHELHDFHLFLQYEVMCTANEAVPLGPLLCILCNIAVSIPTLHLLTIF